jgi:hypothetical protein
MDLQTVERAIVSLRDFPGYVGIMGGEPTLHPQFVEICGLMRKHISPEKRHLMTAGFKWEKYEKIIKRTFAENVVFNNHNDESQKHHPMLLSIGDMVEDTDYVRESIAHCWVDQRWGASINPKGCFFCEIAAAMDLLFEGPGGMPIENGWWCKDPEVFREQQRRYCLQCGACVPYIPGKLVERLDSVSQSNYQRLAAAGSPKLLGGRVKVVDTTVTATDLAAMAENWQPWNHLGEKLREGTGKTQLELYGPAFGRILKFRRNLRAKFWTFRRIEVWTNRMLWKMGIE